jgi:hypothetical protein
MAVNISYGNTEVLISAVGLLMVATVSISLWRTFSLFDKKTPEEKCYHKVSMLNLTTLGITLITVGGFVAIFPMIVQLYAINRNAAIAVSAHINCGTAKKEDSKKTPCEKDSKQRPPHNCVVNYTTFPREKK